MSVSDALAIDHVVDTARYPLSEDAGAGWAHVVSRVRQELDGTGCSVLPDFIRPACAKTLRDECAAIAPLAYYETETVNAYNIAVDTDLPDDHPARITMNRGNAFVARDLIDPDYVIHRLYTSVLFRRFVAACFGLPALYELADPLSGLVLNVVPPSSEHPWHFDTNEFTVSMLTQEPEGGGVFEYCPNIRSADRENFPGVRAVLEGRADHLVRRLKLRPGDLQLFKGRYSLHRVSRVHGTTVRHAAIFAYSQWPGVIGSVARTRQLFGRVLPEHRAAAGRAVRLDRLLD
jgi:hypothetical protein